MSEVYPEGVKKGVITKAILLSIFEIKAVVSLGIACWEFSKTVKYSSLVAVSMFKLNKT